MTTATLDSARRPGQTGRWIVILIGIFKLFKGCLLVLAAVGALALTRPQVTEVVTMWVKALDFGPYPKHIGDWIVNHLLDMHINTLKVVAVGCGLYATLFFTEGAGLLLNKTWAEWMVVVTSAGLIPLELTEIYRHRSIVGFVTLILNVTIVVYLYRHVRQHQSHINPTQTSPAPPRPDAGSCEPGTSAPRSEASASVPQ